MAVELPQYLRLSEICVPTSWAGGGYDSNVFRYQDQAVKVYKENGYGAGILMLYEIVTRRASIMVESEKWILTTPFAHTRSAVRVVPLQLINKDGRWVGLSDFVSGPSLASNPQIFDKIDLTRGLIDLGFRLEDRLGVCGIEIIPLNVKLIQENGSQTLYITDLCADLMYLRKTDSGINY